MTRTRHLKELAAHEQGQYLDNILTYSKYTNHDTTLLEIIYGNDLLAP